MNIHKLPLSYIVNHIAHRDPITLVRMGDGECACAMGLKGENCDGHSYYSDLGIALKQTLAEPRDYIYSIGPKIVTRENWLAVRSKKMLEQYSIEWYDSEAMLAASVNGTLSPFIDILRREKVLIVGAKHLKVLQEPWGLGEGLFVETPLPDAWLDFYRIKEDVLKAAGEVKVILFSAGMTSKVLIWELYPLLGKTHSLVDTGSLFDMYCGKNSRSYARKMTIEQKQQLLEKNFRGWSDA